MQLVSEFCDVAVLLGMPDPEEGSSTISRNFSSCL